MYEARPVHSLHLEEVREGIKSSSGGIKKRITVTIMDEGSLRVYIRSRKNPGKQKICFFNDGRVESEYSRHVQLGIKLLKEAGIVLIYPNPSIYEV